ncbi:MAG: hypothetical protein M3O50_22155 [Myxococcota bacterium]|nr:hypothetical protein [Myxococcota bacterium]
MRDARPLLETGSETERALLAAGVAERPNTASVREAAKMLGLFPQAALVGIAFMMGVRAVRWTSLTAWGALPLAGMAVLGLIAYESAPPPGSVAPQPPTPARSLVPVSTASLEPANARVLQPVIPTVEFEQLRPASRRPRAGPGTRASSASATVGAAASAPASSESLREQSALLDRAHALIASGHARTATALLDTYDRRFGGKALSEEALLLRIEALLPSGEHAKALALAQQFARTHPASVHGERVAALIHSLSQ